MIDCVVVLRAGSACSRKRVFVNPDAVASLEMRSADELRISEEHLQDPGEKFCVLKLINGLEFIACHDDEQLAEAIVLSKQNKTITAPDSP